VPKARWKNNHQMKKRSRALYILFEPPRPGVAAQTKYKCQRHALLAAHAVGVN
jgi:hypothetical protein